jgi:peptide deformylase
MALLEILNHTHPALRSKAQPVQRVDKEIRRLIRDMMETMRAAPGIGLAAPQVGVLKQVIVFDTGEDGCSGALVNPRIVRSEGEATDVEGCLSIPGLQGMVPRAAAVVVQGLDERGRPVEIQADGLLARVLQHEIDHLHGVLFIDRAILDTLRWVSREEEEGEEPKEAVAVG